MYAIETDKLSKSFNGFKAVDELCLQVPQGSVYGFLGPNGAGKTTTIKMLTGLSKPTGGEIKIQGKDVRFGSLKNRDNIGYLPDVPHFYDWMRPAEYLRFSGELFSIDSKVLKKRIEYLLELVGLKGVKKKIGGFSRGMKQRLGIAQALINEPKVILLDEPTSALDPIGRKEVIDIITLLTEKVTVFFSTHILSDIERVCDRVVILNNGKALIEDSITNLRQKYSKPAILLEVERGNRPEILLDALKLQKWVENVSGDEEIKISVNSIRDAQFGITGLLNEMGVALKKFTILEPSLEDIFLKVVNKQ